MKQIDSIKNIFLEKDADGRSIIDMVVKNDSNFLSPYYGKYPVINSEVAEYLDNSQKAVLPKSEIKIRIKSNEIDDNEKIIYEEAIKNHYQYVKLQILKELLSNRWTPFVMFIVGIIVIAFMFVANYMEIPEVWSTVLEIIGWVFIWEAADKFFIERKTIRNQLRYANKMINAVVEYEPL